MQTKHTRPSFRRLIALGSICALSALAQPAFSQPQGQDAGRANGATPDRSYPMPAEKTAPQLAAPDSASLGYGNPEKNDTPKHDGMRCDGHKCDGMGATNSDSMKNGPARNNAPPMTGGSMTNPGGPYTPPGGVYYGN